MEHLDKNLHNLKSNELRDIIRVFKKYTGEKTPAISRTNYPGFAI